MQKSLNQHEISLKGDDISSIQSSERLTLMDINKIIEGSNILGPTFTQ